MGGRWGPHVDRAESGLNRLLKLHPSIWNQNCAIWYQGLIAQSG